MAIVSIIEQPSVNDIRAAYRPIILTVRATRTDGNKLPPVVYCDVYIGGVFYKTINKTQYKTLNATNSDWQFDLQDPMQEVFRQKIAANGQAVITEEPSIMKEVFCRFRSSGFDTNGFIDSDGTAPVQGTGTIAPVSGTGTISNAFFVVNCVLQHEQNQVLSAHLGYYKNGTWQATAFPLTHRPNGYKICRNDSDVFPLINLSGIDLKCLRIHYKLKGASSYATKDHCFCTPITFDPFVLPNGEVSIPYSFSLPFVGTGPFTLTIVTKPAWMTIARSGMNINFTGAPPDGSDATDIDVEFTIANDCSTVNVAKQMTVDAFTACVAVDFAIEAMLLPNAVRDIPWSFVFPLVGDPPFVLENVVKPGWMTIEIVNSLGDWILILYGTPPDTDTDVEVSFDITNCDGANSIPYDDTINITAPTGEEEPAACKAYKLHGGSDGTEYQYQLCLTGTTAFITVAPGITKTKCARTGSVTILSGDGSFEDSGLVCNYNG